MIYRLKPDVFQSKVDALEQEKKAKEEEGRKAAEEMKAELAAASAAQTKPKVSSAVVFLVTIHKAALGCPCHHVPLTENKIATQSNMAQWTRKSLV